MGEINQSWPTRSTPSLQARLRADNIPSVLDSIFQWEPEPAGSGAQKDDDEEQAMGRKKS